jgi:hypothetical protein
MPKGVNPIDDVVEPENATIAEPLPGHFKFKDILFQLYLHINIRIKKE